MKRCRGDEFFFLGESQGQEIKDTAEAGYPHQVIRRTTTPPLLGETSPLCQPFAQISIHPLNVWLAVTSQCGEVSPAGWCSVQM